VYGLNQLSEAHPSVLTHCRVAGRVFATAGLDRGRKKDSNPQVARIHKTRLMSHASHMLSQNLKIVPPSDMIPGMVCRGLDSPDLRTSASCRAPSRSHPPGQPSLSWTGDRSAVLAGKPQRRRSAPQTGPPKPRKRARAEDGLHRRCRFSAGAEN